MTTGTRMILILFAAAFISSAACTGAEAQLPNEDFRPLLRAEELPKIAEELALDTDAALLFRAFSSHFDAEFTESSEQARTRIWAITQRRQEHRTANPGQPVPDLGLAGAEDEWLAKRRELEAEFDRNVIALLPVGQLEHWERTSRRIRRERGIAHARAVRNIRHHADLIDVLNAVGIERTDELQNATDEYSAEIDRAIREFEFNHQTLFRRYTDLRFNSSPEQSEDRQAEIKRAYDAWSRYPDSINDIASAYAARIAGAIGQEEQASAFLSEVTRREYEAVFVPSPVERCIESLLAFEGLLPAERRALDQVVRSYRQAQAERRDLLVNALRQWESPTALAGREREYKDIRENGGDFYAIERGHPALPLWERDSRAVHETCEAIRSIFSEERYHSLPIDAQVLLGW